MKAAIYIRVSTEDQAREGTSLEVQREFLESYAKRENWEIYYPEKDNIYNDDGYSGYTLERPALSRLLKDAKLKKFDVVVVYKIDRFARNNRLLLNLVEELNNAGIGFKSATEAFDTVSAAGKLALSMLGTVAQFERDRIIERVFPGMVKGAEKGNWQGARYSPYGYSYNKFDSDKKLKVVKEEADIVKLIYTLYLSGQSTTQIAGYLYKREYKTRSGGKFHSKLVCDILKNPIYTGKIIWNRHHYDKKQKTLRGYKYVKNDPSEVVSGMGKHEPIINEAEFEAVQKKLENNRKGMMVRKGSQEYPLTGILICGNCGHKLQGCLSIASRENKKTKSKRRYYRCSGRATHYVDCHEPYIQSENIEEQIYAIIDVVLNYPELDERRISNLIEMAATTRNDNIEDEIKIIDGKIKENVTKQEKLGKAFAEDSIAEGAFKNLILPLRDEQKSLEGKKQKLKLNLIKRERSGEYQKILNMVINHFDFIKEDLDATGRKGLLRLLFNYIVISDGKIKEFELYEPFKSLYERKGIKWQLKENQRVLEKPACVSTYAHSDAK
ncbi:MAG: recombinase family protein [Candidatus Omnitrophica bacterium]|nr:recombinase family protein [Candidatus Omnitrophota bacterium]